MFADITLNIPAVLSDLLPLMIAIADLIFKSALLIVATWLAIRYLSQHLSASARHLLWANVVFSLALLPFLPNLTSTVDLTVEQSELLPIAQNTVELVTVSTIVSPSTAASVAASTGGTAAADLWAWLPAMLLLMYLLPCIYLLSRLAYSAICVWRVSTATEAESDLELVILTNKLKQQFDVSRPVEIKFSADVESPVSFGLLKPEVVFPEAARQWPGRVFENALRHEFAHIQRLDWLTSAFAYIVCCLLWINPLIWRVLRQMNQEAENACDSAVVGTGVKSDDYAEDLLSVTRMCKSHVHGDVLLQSVFGAGTLKQRVELLLNADRESGQQSWWIKISMAASSMILLVLLSASSVVAVNALSPIESTEGRSLSALWGDYRQHQQEAERRIAELSAARSSDQESWIDQRIRDSHIAVPATLPQLPTLSRGRYRVPVQRHDEIDFSTLENDQQLAFNVNATIDLSPPETTLPNFQMDLEAERAYSELPRMITTSQSRAASFSRSELFAELRRVEEEFYDRLNEAMEDESLHIKCVNFRQTGSYIPRRSCDPNFIRQAQGEALNFSAYLRTTVGTGDIRYLVEEKVAKLTEEINRALRDDDELYELYRYLSSLREMAA